MDASHYKSCSTYLHKQIELINPKLIVTLGEKVYQYLSNDMSSFALWATLALSVSIFLTH